MTVNTPPMGWNSWNTFGKDISDSLIRETADKMAESGLLEASIYRNCVIICNYEDICNCLFKKSISLLIAI